MADIEYSGDYGPEEATPEEGSSTLRDLVSIAGALTSLALVIGIGIWGYRLMVRDVSGVPVVRALEGPMRVQPKDPGGQQADYQGLAVNRIAAQGTAAPPADRLILAPRPVGLTEEDTPVAAIAEPRAAETETAATDTAPAPAAPPPGDSVSDETVAALVEELTAKVRPVPAVAKGDDDHPAPTPAAMRIEHPAPLDASLPVASAPTSTVPAPEPALFDAPGVKVSLRPVARPARAVPQAAAVTPAVAVAGDGAGLDVDPDTLPVGTRLAQLGAYDTPEIARAEWAAVTARFPDYMDGKKRVIQQASSGGRTFYRLRAMGFDDLADARRFCSALVAEKADCIPVTVR